MNNFLDFSQTQYRWWDYIWDVFNDPMVIESIEDYKKYICFWENDETKWLTDGDLIQFIFGDDDEIEKFLQFFCSNPIFDTQDYPKIIALILSINEIERMIHSTPLSIIWIFEQKIIDIIKDADKEVYWTDDETQVSPYSLSEWLKMLIDLDFPCITDEWQIVYYHSKSIEKWLINVWNPKSQSKDKVMTMDKNWQIVSERDDSHEHSNDSQKIRLIGWTKKLPQDWKKKIDPKGSTICGDKIIRHPHFVKKDEDTGK
jgi:hypothetical protein